MPPENVFTSCVAASVEVEALEQLVGAALGVAASSRWWSRPTITRFFRALSRPSTVACCAATPMRSRTARGSRDDVDARDASPCPRSAPRAW